MESEEDPNSWNQGHVRPQHSTYPRFGNDPRSSYPVTESERKIRERIRGSGSLVCVLCELANKRTEDRSSRPIQLNEPRRRENKVARGLRKLVGGETADGLQEKGI